MKFKDFEYEIKFGLAKILSYTGTEKRVEIPSKIGRYNVYTICTNSFLGLKTLEEIVIPKSIGKIEDSAFVDCENLKKVEIGIVEDFNKPFKDCSSEIKFYTESPRMACKIEKLGENFDIFCEKDFKIEVIDEENKECILKKVRARSTNLIIPDEIDGYKVTQLDFTLGAKSSFSKVKLPKFLKEIPSEFFAYQRYIKEIEIGKDIETIGSNAFYCCGTDENKVLKFSKKLKNIGSSAFSSADISIEFEPGTELENISGNGFQNAHVDFLGVKKFPLINTGIFINATVKNLKLSKDHEIIPSKTFTNARIENISGLENIVKIENRAFANTTFDSPINFDLSNIIEIGDGAFEASDIERFFIPKNLKLSEGMFRNSKASKIIFDKDYVFNTIPKGCFQNMSYLVEIELPESIKIIERDAFYNDKSLEKINIENIEEIHSNAFYRTNIREFNFGKNLKNLEIYAFQDLKNLVKVTFDKDCKISSIPEYCFHRDESLTEVILSDEIKTIETGAFRYSNLSSINLDNVENLGEESLAFTPIKEVNLSKVKIIPNRCFISCKSLEKVKLGSELKEIDYGAFQETKSLKNISLPDTLEEIGSYVFRGSGLEEVDIPDNVKSFESGTFYDCRSLRKLSLGKGIKRIERESFCSLDALEELNLGNVETICQYGINNCNKLSKLTIPETTKDLYENAITYCSNLSEVRIEGTLQRLDLGVFSNCPSLTKIQTDDVASGKKLLSRKKNSITEIIPITPVVKKTRGRKKKEEI